MYIGVYEYNEHMRRVRFTEYVPKILALDEEETERLGSDVPAFRKFVDDIRKNSVA